MTLHLSSKQFHAHNQTAVSAIMSQAVCFYVNHTFWTSWPSPCFCLVSSLQSKLVMPLCPWEQDAYWSLKCFVFQSWKAKVEGTSMFLLKTWGNHANTHHSHSCCNYHISNISSDLGMSLMVQHCVQPLTVDYEYWVNRSLLLTSDWLHLFGMSGLLLSTTTTFFMSSNVGSAGTASW